MSSALCKKASVNIRPGLTMMVNGRIDDRKSANPRMRGLFHASKIIFQERGLRAFFQGFVPTTARQAANSATRFGSYTTLKQLAEGYVAPGEKLGTVSTFAIGGLAGLITVYASLVRLRIRREANAIAAMLRSPLTLSRQGSDRRVDLGAGY